MSEQEKPQTRWEKIFDWLHTLAKIASFISLVMSVVIKSRVLLGLPNNAEQKKKEFLERKEKESKAAEAKKAEKN